MAGIIDYSATGSNRLKNWELMTKGTDEKLIFKQDKSNFWTFHETFSNHIRNMGWEDIMVYSIDSVEKNLTTQFGEIEMNALNREWQTIANSDTSAVLTKKLKQSSMYTWILNSVDQDFKKYLTQNASKHDRQGQQAWKLITEHSVKSDKQAIRRAMCKMHKLKLDDFNYNVHDLINAVIDNKAILTSCGETDNSIVSNLFRILSDAPCPEFKSWVLTNQNVYDDGGTFDLDNFLVSCPNKYTNFVADGLWKSGEKSKKDLEKTSEIVALNTRFDNLEKLLMAKHNDKPTQQPAKSGWKVTPPKPGEPWTITKNNKVWNWCKYHQYWTTGHKTDNCRKGEAERNGTPNGGQNRNNPSLALNLAALENEDIMLADTDLSLTSNFDDTLDSLVVKHPMTCTPCSNDGDQEHSEHLN